MSRHRPPDHHGMRGLVDHFITGSRRASSRHRRTYGRRLLRVNAAACGKCVTADARDARLSRIHAAYRRRHR